MPNRKTDVQQRLNAFVGYCDAIGVQDDDLLSLVLRPQFGGGGEMIVTLGELKSLRKEVN